VRKRFGIAARAVGWTAAVAAVVHVAFHVALGEAMTCCLPLGLQSGRLVGRGESGNEFRRSVIHLI
jgi:hypothetical protein